MRRSTIKALAIPENPYATMSLGELEARILGGERAQASVPPEVSDQLRITAQTEADAWRQSAEAAAARDQAAAANARALASQMAAEKTRLEGMNASYEAWSGRTSTVRETAAQAKAELGQRGYAQPAEKPPTMARWWPKFDADLDAMDRAIEREHQAAIAAGQPWPPQHSAQAEPTYAEATAIIARLRRAGYLLEPHPNPEDPALVTGASATQAPAPHMPGDRSACLDTLQARADQAAHRIAVDNAAREARAQYTTRLGRQARVQAEPTAQRQAEASDGIEIEL